MAFNQPLAGSIEPAAPSFRSASAADRRAFYKVAGDRAVERLRGQLAKGLGANGRRMKARKFPRADGADGPVLTPHGAASRASRLLAARSWADGVTLFWHAGISKAQKTPWGTILGFHADGKGSLPVRDARLSKSNVRALRDEMAKWWEERARKAQRRRAAAAPKLAPKPGRFSKAQQALADRYPVLAKFLVPGKKGR